MKLISNRSRIPYRHLLSCLFLFSSLGVSSLPAVELPGKYHPGHYVAIQEAESVGNISALDEPAVRGVSKRYYWAELEPKENLYDFAGIRADLAFLRQHHKQLVVFITDKTFNPRHNPLPEYLAKYALPNRHGFTAKRWDPVVSGRFIALARALAKEFNGDPNFEGIASEESALMITPEVQREQGYTPEKYRDALILMLTESSKAFDQSQVFWYMNHLEGNSDYLGDIAAAVVGQRVVMGGPDILPYRKRLQAAYKLYDRFNGRLKLFCSAQDDSYRHDKTDSRNMATASFTRNSPPPPGGYVSMREIFQFAREKLHVNYIFWNYKNYQGSPGAYTGAYIRGIPHIPYQGWSCTARLLTNRLCNLHARTLHAPNMNTI